MGRHAKREDRIIYRYNGKWKYNRISANMYLQIDLGNDAITNKFLCEKYIDKKNNPKFLRVAVFSTMIWDSIIYYGTKGWRVKVICYARKTISNYCK